MRRLETEAVYRDGRIAPGTPDQITGGVFTASGAHVNVVRNRGPVVTYGVNDMVLDNGASSIAGSRRKGSPPTARVAPVS